MSIQYPVRVSLTDETLILDRDNVEVATTFFGKEDYDAEYERRALDAAVIAECLNKRKALNELEEAALVAGEAYQIIGDLALAANLYDHPEVQRALDWFSGFEPGVTYKDGASILPWPKEELKPDPALPPASGVPEAEAVALAAQSLIRALDEFTLGIEDDFEINRFDDIVVAPLVKLRAALASSPPVAAPSGEAGELLSCPFCGKKPEIHHHYDGMDIYGVNCGGHAGFDGETLKEATNKWNARAPSPIASEPKDAGSGEGQDIAEQAAQFLWSLLDDIDTLSDHVKADNVTYREIAERIQRRRFEVGDTDGYTVTFKRKAEIRTAPSGTKP